MTNAVNYFHTRVTSRSFSKLLHVPEELVALLVLNGSSKQHKHPGFFLQLHHQQTLPQIAAYKLQQIQVMIGSVPMYHSCKPNIHIKSEQGTVHN